MENQKQNGNIIAIITMMFLYAMISFVTNLAAPIGVIWKNVFADSGSANMIGMLGNAMNFLAYLFMGIPAGKLLTKIGYKKTALTGIATGFVGVFIQFLSGKFGVDVSGFSVYLFGAFISGFAVCILNTVVNPMLNLLGGGGNRGNQLIQIGGTLNSLSGTLTPLLAGVLVGTVTANTSMSDVAPLLFIGMAVFIAAFFIIWFVAIPEPNIKKENVQYDHSPWSFRHCVLGVIGIFFYVGVEIGIPAQLIFYISSMDFTGAASVGGAFAAVYWLLMMCGRFLSSFISGAVSTKTQMTVVSTVAILLLLTAIFLPEANTLNFSLAGDSEIASLLKLDDHGTGVVAFTIPTKCVLIAICGLCTSIMWGGIFNLAVEGLGKYTAQASGIFMMMVVGGGVMPLIQDAVAKAAGPIASYWVIIAMIAYILFYALAGCKNVNKDIPVE